MRLFRLPAALALVMLCAIPAQAQTQEQTAPVQTGLWTVTPFLSLTFGGDSDTTSLGFGGALGYAFTDLITVEGELGYVFDLAGDDEFADWSTVSLMGNVLYHFPLANGSTPYAAGGIGFVREKLEFGDITRDTLEFGVNIGGGIKTPITDTLSARGDIRYFKYTDAAPDGFRLYGGVTWLLGR